MKNPSDWKFHDKPFTLGDMMNTEILRCGVKHPRYIQALFTLILSRLDDPRVTEADVLSLDGDSIGPVADRLMESLQTGMKRATETIALRKMVNDAHETR